MELDDQKSASVSPTDIAWEGMYERLRRFREERGHARVPASWPRDRKLADWVREQRTIHAQLEQNQIEKLLALGFDFGGWDTQWYFHFFEVLSHFNQTGGLPSGQNNSPARWLKKQRAKHKKGKLAAYQFRWLNSLGMRWEELYPVMGFEQHFADLVSFKQKHGHCKAPVHFPENLSLGNWVSKIRGYKHRLTEEQICRLDELGFDWNPQQTAWENRYREVTAHIEQHGQFPSVSAGHQDLADWVRHQRKHRDALSPEQRQKLDALNMSWNPSDDRWEGGYSELVRFRKQFGHCRVPAEGAAFLPLYKWLHYQKSHRKRLPPKRRERLDQLGIDWAIEHQPTTRQRMAQLKEFYSKNGHCNASQPDNRDLAIWLSNLRRRKARLPASMVTQLEAMRIEWSPTQSAFETRLAELAAFRKRHGHSRVPLDWPESPNLGQWVQTQKFLHKQGRMSAERKRRLDELGFEWGDWDTVRWEENYRRLAAFRDEFGHCRVPQKHDSTLSAWVGRQRFNRADLNAEQIRQLDEIGFPWDRNRQGPVVLEKDHAPWDQRLAELRGFHANVGHSRVPATYETNPGLARWVAYQRENWSDLSSAQLLALVRLDFTFKPADAIWIRHFGEFAESVQKGKKASDLYQENHSLWQWISRQRTIRDKLSPEKVRLLQEMGIDWNPLASAWPRQYQKLVEFHRIHEHLRISKAHDLALTQWMSTQRQLRKNLSAEQRNLLDAIGFSWEPQADELKKRFAQLAAFKQKYGHCNVPTRSPEFSGLGRWVEGQRARRDDLPPERVAHLNAIGFVWEGWPR